IALKRARISLACPGAMPFSRDAIIRDAIGPGLIELMRTPLLAHSAAALRVSPITACLLALYALMPGVPVRPATLELLIIAPPPVAAIPGRTCLRPRNT